MSDVPPAAVEIAEAVMDEARDAVLRGSSSQVDIAARVIATHPQTVELKTRSRIGWATLQKCLGYIGTKSSLTHEIESVARDLDAALAPWTKQENNYGR